MKLTVIGCSPAWPNPGSAQSGYLVESDGRLLLDCGPGVLARLREREPWPRIDAIVLTHFHLDHWGDLVPWTFGALHGPGHGANGRPELWLPPAGVDTLRGFGDELRFADVLDDAFELHEYADDAPFTVAGAEVTAVRVPHYDVLAYGLRVSDGRRTLAYSGDSAPSDNLVEVARGADLFLCEATLDRGEPDPRGHLTADEARDAAARGEAKRLVIVHRPNELALDESLERARDGWSVTL